MTKLELSPHDIIVRLGVYRALYNSAIQFNSILFRVIVGVLAITSGVPADTVALVTLLEFLLNGILDVPFGYVADRFGRVPSIIVSLALIMSGLTCVYIALLIHNDVSRWLFIAHGIFIGIAKPLSSGSIEAFYQDALKSRCQNEDHEKMAMTSLTTSQNHGKYFTTIAVVAAFAAVWYFDKLQWLPHTFIFGILLYVSCIVTLWRDYIQLGDRNEHLYASPMKEIILTLVRTREAKMSLAYNLSFWMTTVVILGYLPVTLGREYAAHSSFAQWAFMGAFMLGSSGLAWVVRGHLLPVLIHRVTMKQYFLIFYALIFALSAGYLVLHDYAPMPIQIAYVFLYGILFSTATSAILNYSMNLLMEKVKKQDYATALSIQNIPGFLWVGFYSLYLKFYRDGAPSVRESLVSMVIISIAFAIFVLLVEKPDTKVEVAK